MRRRRLTTMETIRRRWRISGVTMRTEYDVRSTSSRTAKVKDIVLRPTSHGDNPTRRRVVRTLLVDNVHDAKMAVKICLMHQRRAAGSDEWTDADSLVHGPRQC